MSEQIGPAPEQRSTIRAGRLRRTAPIAGFAARAAGGRIVAGLRARGGDSEAIDRFHQRTAERYAELLGHSKGVLMKAGQIMSTYDVDPEGSVAGAYHQALQRLQADAPPMDYETARETLELDLGKPIGELFTEFSQVPMAAASIGQVHRARLADGRDVVVKIQYPGVAQAIHDDLANTELLATFLKLGTALTPRAMRTDQRATAAEISERIAEEVDYRNEARNIEMFAELYCDHPFIRVPDPIPERSGDHVLTMTYLDGVDWAKARTADQDLRNAWAHAISYFAFAAYRHSNLFNADPHPGNYRFGMDGTVGFVDFGCVKQFPEHIRRGVLGLIRAAGDGDPDTLFELLHEYGFVDADSDLTAAEAYEWWSLMAVGLLTEQPHHYTHEDSTGIIRSLYDSSDASIAFRKMNVPSDWAMLSRINMGMYSIFSAMDASVYSREILDVLDGVGEPYTELGRKHVEWARARSLPFGLDIRR
ncbi:MAG: AarF/ABC1/UbiB kinase family protein [Nocardia sp.]|nr:AarF/ABC1/UbiB kinase family protein [Nocardia sp.]